MATTFKGSKEMSEIKPKLPQGPPRQSDFLRKRLQGKGGAKYFDSGDYNMAKSNHGRIGVPIGKTIPTPESLPHRKLSSTKQSNLLGGTSPPTEGELDAITPEEKSSTEGGEQQQKAKQQITDQTE